MYNKVNIKRCFIIFFFTRALVDSVKAFNFGPNGNFGLIIATSLAPLAESCTNNVQNKNKKARQIL
jgi:hypothetical protein